MLTEENFRRANVEATQTVDIVSFVDALEIAPMYFESPYYLAPDKRGEKGYALLRQTLIETGKVAIAKVVIRTRQYRAALLPVNDVIVMDTLRYANELRSADELDVPTRNLKAVGTFPPKITPLAWEFTCAEMGPTGGGYDTKTAHGGTDHRRAQGRPGRHRGSRALPQARHLGRHVL